MTPLVHDLRKQFQISGLCQVLVGSVRPYWEEGIARHQVHHAPSPAAFTKDGALAPESRGNLALVAEFGRQTGISRFLEDQKGTMPYRAPFETLILSLPLGGHSAACRTKVLIEACDSLQEIMFAGTPLPMVTVSREVMIGRNCVIRHHLVAIFDDYRNPFWVHPALARFGLARIPFPEAQKHRDLGSISGWVDPPGSPVFDLDPWGYPRWYPHAVALEGRTPVHEGEAFRVGPLDLPVPEIIRITSHRMLTDFESFFGAGTLIPGRSKEWLR